MITQPNNTKKNNAWNANIAASSQQIEGRIYGIYTDEQGQKIALFAPSESMLSDMSLKIDHSKGGSTELQNASRLFLVQVPESGMEIGNNKDMTNSEALFNILRGFRKQQAITTTARYEMGHDFADNKNTESEISPDQENILTLTDIQNKFSYIEDQAEYFENGIPVTMSLAVLPSPEGDMHHTYSLESLGENIKDSALQHITENINMPIAKRTGESDDDYNARIKTIGDNAHQTLANTNNIHITPALMLDVQSNVGNLVHKHVLENANPNKQKDDGTTTAAKSLVTGYSYIDGAIQPTIKNDDGTTTVENTLNLQTRVYNGSASKTATVITKKDPSSLENQKKEIATLINNSFKNVERAIWADIGELATMDKEFYDSTQKNAALHGALARVGGKTYNAYLNFAALHTKDGIQKEDNLFGLDVNIPLVNSSGLISKLKSYAGTGTLPTKDELEDMVSNLMMQARDNFGKALTNYAHYNDAGTVDLLGDIKETNKDGNPVFEGSVLYDTLAKNAITALNTPPQIKIDNNSTAPMPTTLNLLSRVVDTAIALDKRLGNKKFTGIIRNALEENGGNVEKFDKILNDWGTLDRDLRIKTIQDNVFSVPIPSQQSLFSAYNPTQQNTAILVSLIAKDVAKAVKNIEENAKSNKYPEFKDFNDSLIEKHEIPSSAKLAKIADMAIPRAQQMKASAIAMGYIEKGFAQGQLMRKFLAEMSSIFPIQKDANNRPFVVFKYGNDISNNNMQFAQFTPFFNNNGEPATLSLGRVNQALPHNTYAVSQGGNKQNFRASSPYLEMGLIIGKVGGATDTKKMREEVLFNHPLSLRVLTTNDSKKILLPKQVETLLELGANGGIFVKNENVLLTPFSRAVELQKINPTVKGQIAHILPSLQTNAEHTLHLYEQYASNTFSKSINNKIDGKYSISSSRQPTFMNFTMGYSFDEKGTLEYKANVLGGTNTTAQNLHKHNTGKITYIIHSNKQDGQVNTVSVGKERSLARVKDDAVNMLYAIGNSNEQSNILVNSNDNSTNININATISNGVAKALHDNAATTKGILNRINETVKYNVELFNSDPEYFIKMHKGIIKNETAPDNLQPVTQARGGFDDVENTQKNIATYSANANKNKQTKAPTESPQEPHVDSTVSLNKNKGTVLIELIDSPVIDLDTINFMDMGVTHQQQAGQKLDNSHAKDNDVNKTFQNDSSPKPRM